MQFTFTSQLQLLKVTDTAISLVNVDDITGDMTFEASYSISQSDAIQNNGLAVDVSIVLQEMQPLSILKNTNIMNPDGRTLIHNIVNQANDAATANNERSRLTLSTHRSDVTAKINNTIVPAFAAHVSPSRIIDFKKTRLVTRPVGELRQENVKKPLLQFITSPNPDVDLNTRSLMFNMITKEGKDPSEITGLTHRSMSARNTFGGLSRKIRRQEHATFPLGALLNSYVHLKQTNVEKKVTTDSLSDVTLVSVASVVGDDVINVPVTLFLQSDKLDAKGTHHNNVIVKFELINVSNGQVIDRVTKPLDINQHKQIYYAPTKHPMLQVAHSDISSNVRLEIQQIDEKATSIRLYKKLINKAAVSLGTYEFAGQYNLTSKERSLLLNVHKPLQNTVIYRAIAIGQHNEESSEFVNVVINPAHYVPNRAVSVTATPIDTGIAIDVRSLPPDISAVQVIRQTPTINDYNFTLIDVAQLVDDTVRHSDRIMVEDTKVTDGWIYHYAVRLIRVNGTYDVAGSAIIEYVRPKNNKIVVEVTNLQVSHEADGPSVSFAIDSVINDSNLDTIRSLLQKRGLESYFTNDIANEREKLGDIIGHSVERINLTTGAHENFGVLSDNVFHDDSTRINYSVMPLQYGNSYRYVITPLIRAPETVFNDFIKTKVDALTHKTYTFKPAKFLHPLVLNTGTLVTEEGLKTRFAKNVMSYGNVGASVTTDVSFDLQPARVTDATAARFDNNTVLLTWKIDGPLDNVDHFVIMKDVHGVRTAIGKAHSQFEFGSYSYVHHLSPQDVGAFSYVIIPVSNDYHIGTEVQTNIIVYEA